MCSLYLELGLQDDAADELIAESEVRQEAQGKFYINVSGIKCGGPGSGRPGPCPDPEKASVWNSKNQIIPGMVGKLSGIDTSKWDIDSVQSQAKLSAIHQMELLHEAGKHDELKKTWNWLNGGMGDLYQAKTNLVAKADAQITAPPPAAFEWKKVGGKLGTEEGGLYEFEGKKYYVKTPEDPNRARNEVLAQTLRTCRSIDC
jgi:hypothetical protein